MSRPACSRRAAAAIGTVLLLEGCAFLAPAPEREPGFGLTAGELAALVEQLGIDDATTLLVGAGDIARCDSLAAAEATAAIVEAVIGAAGAALVFTTGDHAYERGTRSELERCYGPTWGRFEALTRPSPGNHDYETGDGAPYYDYFSYFASHPADRARGYYSFDIGGWHAVSLNSMLPMDHGSPQIEWLEADLASADGDCALAYWHHPLFSSGRHGINPWDNGRDSKPAWDLLTAFRAELVVNGHEHFYERFAPQDSRGAPDPDGIRQIVVGTGGGTLRRVPWARGNSAKIYEGGYGVLVTLLGPDHYRWAFIGTDGAIHDRSDDAIACR